MIVILLLFASLITTIRDYRIYAQQPDVGYLFEQAAVELAGSLTAESPQTTVYVDERFWSGWPALRFLAGGRSPVLFTAESFPDSVELPAAVYAWPYAPLDYLPPALPDAALVTAEAGGLARGDLEQTPYSLYTRYYVQAAPEPSEPLANFDRQYWLRAAEATLMDEQTIQIELQWQADEALAADQPLPVAFVHVIRPAGLLAQSDVALAGGLWPGGTADWWRPRLTIAEQRTLVLPEPFDPQQHRLLVGLYRPETLQRLPLVGNSDADEIEIEVSVP